MVNSSEVDGPGGGKFPPESRFALCPSVLTGPSFDAWTSRVRERCLEIEAVRSANGPAEVSRLLGPGQRFAATASSVTIGGVLSDQEIHELMAMIATNFAGDWVRAVLGPAVALDLDQAWVRRQYAPARYPGLHAPHGWHQDGALGFDFQSHPAGPFPAGALVTMVTCWVALDPCGLNAPGLELVTRGVPELIAPRDLAQDRVAARFSPDEFWRPVFRPGDALLFQGDILHRTHVVPSMTQDRTSLEFRFFPADRLPARLQQDHFVPLTES